MESIQIARITQECRDLVLALMYFGDHNERAQAVDLFAEDGSWLRGGRLFTGRAELLASYDIEPPSLVMRHINGGTIVTVNNEDNASAITYYLAYRYDRGDDDAQLPLPLELPFSLGEWHDRFVRTAEGWRVASRSTERVFMRRS